MSRWDSLRPSQEEKKFDEKDSRRRKDIKLSFRRQEQSREEHPGHRHGSNQPLSLFDRQTMIVGSAASSNHQSSRPRIRSRSLALLASSHQASVSYLERHLHNIRHNVNLCKQPNEVLEDLQSNIELSIQAIYKGTIQSEQECTDVCLLLFQVLALRTNDTDFGKLTLQTLERFFMEAVDKKWKLSVSKEAVTEMMQSISLKYRQQASPQALRALVCLVKLQVDNLPAETTAHCVVDDVFLPFLDEHKQAKDAEALQITCMVYDVMTSLLQNRPHASALLAPLVHDVALLDGRENTIENPIRTRLLTAFSQRLCASELDANEPGRIHAQIGACRVLTAVVEAIRHISEPSGTNSGEGSNLVMASKLFLYTVISPVSETDAGIRLRKEAFQLLIALIRCYPKLTIALGWNFLVEENGISLLSPCQDLQIAMMSLQTLTMFIKTLPWGRWLNQISKRKTANRSGLYRKAISALGSLFAMIHKELQSEQFLWPWDEFKNVVEALLTDIPYYDEKLLIAAVQIWQELAEMVFDSHIADTKRRMAANLLIASAGGYTTPWGEFVGMCQAGKRWLSSSHDDGSIRFLERLFAAISSEDESVPSRKVLMAILRTFPGAAFQNWKSFQVVVERVSSMEPLTCLEIVEAFMLGRSYFRDAKIMGDEAITLSLQVLESARGKDTPQCIQSALVIYSCFLDDDWKLLEERGELDSHFRKIKMGCFSSSAKLREQACKSLGGFCSQFVGIGAPHRVELLYQRRLIAEDVCSTMLETYVDDNPAVRTMCIFALGNLANAIRESQSPNMLSTEAVYRLCLSMLHCFDDTNDKVVGNAIRCLGHAGFLLAVGASISTSTELLVPIIHVLASKIYSALAVVLNWEAKASLTWKQRSSAKKHGWGACHALRIIFQGISEDYLEAQTSLRKAISCAFKYLVLCQEYFNTLNQKVVGAAIMAISCLPVQLLETIGAETELVGVSLANAILMLLDKDVDLSSSQIETVLLQLLRSASISDAYYVVMNERIAASTFDALYSWMVKQGEEALNARAFEIFALALQRSRRWSNSVALEQKFASRAMRKNKQCSEFVDEPGTTSELVEDEEDEI